MILDAGIVSIFRPHNIALSGEMPRMGYTLHSVGWYGELNFETSPQWETEGRKERKTDARIRVLQDRDILQNDIAILRELDDWESRAETDTVYRITRVYHGKADSDPTEISDISLEVVKP